MTCRQIFLAQLTCILFFNHSLPAQTLNQARLDETTLSADGDYRTVASGNWNRDSIWARFAGGAWITPATPPDVGAGVITIRSGHVVTITSSIVYDQVIVEGGGQVIVAPGINHTLADGPGNDLTINGIWANQGGSWTIVGSAKWMVNDGGTFVHNTTSGIATPLSKATLSKASNFIYRGSSSLVPASTFSGRTYGNLSLESSVGQWSCTASGGSPLIINGNLRIHPGVKWSTGAFSGSMTVQGTILVDGEWIGSGSGNMGTHTFVGAFTIGPGGKYQLATTGLTQGNVVFQGDVTNDGTFATPSNRAVIFNGVHSQMISGSAGITFNKGFTATSSIAIEVGMLIRAGVGSTLVANSDMAVSGTLAGADTNTRLILGGPGNRLTLNDATVSIGAILLRDGRIHTISGTGTLAGCSVVIDSSSTLILESNLTMENGMVDGVKGYVTVANGCTMAFSGSRRQSIPPLSYSNLTVNNPAGVLLSGPTSVNGILRVVTGTLSTGVYTLTLGPEGALQEGELQSVVGKIATTRTLTSGISASFGDLGVEIKPSRSTVGPATVIRVTGTAPAIGGVTSILRYFDVSAPDAGVDATLVFHYATSELNGANESNLQLFKSTDGGATWSAEGGTVNTSAHTITLAGVNTFSRWTAGEVVPAPTLDGISPSFGVWGDNLTVTITGTEFMTGSIGVDISGSGIAVTSLTVNSSTQITAILKIAQECGSGLRDVCVTTSGGTAILRGAFEVVRSANPVPILTAVVPSIGTRGQSVNVSVRGSGFIDGLTTASFGDSITVSSVSVDAMTLTVRLAIAEGAGLGSRNVYVNNPDPGGGSSTLLSAFTVVNPVPTLTSALPGKGVRGRAMSVLLTGTNFVAGIPSVSFGSGISVDSIAVLSSTQLQVWLSVSLVAPSEPRDICVTNAGPGGGIATLVGGFAITTPAPRITSVSPSTGARGKSMIVTIKGSDFISGTSIVTLGDRITIDSVLVANSTQIVARLIIARDAIVGTRHVTVSNTDPGSGSSSLPNAFEVQNPSPLVTGIFPSSCSLGQALTVVLAGEEFLDGVSSIDLGPGIAVNSLACDNNGTRINASINVSLGAITGVRSIVVTNVGPGGGSATLAGSFTVVNPVPSLLSVSPAGGGRGKTLDVALSGVNYLHGITKVEFGVGITVNSVSVKSLTKITANITVASDAIAGARGIVVANPPPGGGSGKLPHVFNVEYLRPELTRLSPAIGSTGERMIVLIEGAYFLPEVTRIDFGDGVSVDSIQAKDARNLSAHITIEAEASPGPRDIVVWNPPPGGGSVRLSQAFNVQVPLPIITRVFPATARRGEGVIVTVDGANFLAGSTIVSFGSDILVDSVIVRNSTTLQAILGIANSATLGPRTITVENIRAGGISTRLLNGFSVSSDATTHLENEPNLIPNRLVLEEAYPNPFNPSTTIRFGLPERCHVKVDVYTILGTAIAQLTDAELPRGYHEVKWIAGDRPSGVYLVRLRSESRESHKQLVSCIRIVLLR